MARKKKNEATTVASPRSRKATDENINKLKSRGQEQEKNKYQSREAKILARKQYEEYAYKDIN